MSIYVAVQPASFPGKARPIEKAMANTVALIVAAGRGERAQAQAGAPPKQYWPLAGRPVLRWTAEAFASQPAISAVQVVIREEDRGHYEAATKGLTLRPPVIGG